MGLSQLRLLIVGASGRLGSAVARQCAGRHGLTAPSHRQLDLERPADLAATLRHLDFDAAINCAALTSPDLCEDQPELARVVNAEAPALIAAECARRGARLVHISTDYVFGGDGDAPLSEDDPPGPVNVYGQTKLAGELAVLDVLPTAVVARVSWLFGADKPSFPDAVLQQALAGHEVRAIADKWSTPTNTDDLAAWIEALLTRHREIHGLLHLCNSGCATWQEYAQATVDIAAELGLLPQRQAVIGESLRGFDRFRAARPVYTPMSNRRFTQMTGIVPDAWQVALRRSLQARRRVPSC